MLKQPTPAPPLRSAEQTLLLSPMSPIKHIPKPQEDGKPINLALTETQLSNKNNS